MLPGLEILTGGLLYLAANTITCTVPKSPRVKVTPITQPIKYDLSRSRSDLDKIRTQTVSPYETDVHATTGGLHHDKPQTVLKVQIGYQEYSNGQICVWYDQVDFQIKLQPKIYIAREYKGGKCKQAILDHEKEHVAVDRKLVNKLSRAIGPDLQQAVNKAGALGPYDAGSLEKVKEAMVEHMNNIVHIHQTNFEQEMITEQQKIDRLDEYERISLICHREGY